jgi:hypothetical protein|tara:strand:+ start:1038 stop:1277 length:240 start_codon:yes stop_codon:yes gene_type:complete
MAKAKDRDFGTIEKLALLADSMQKLFKGKSLVVFELKEREYRDVMENFKDIDQSHKKFTIDISGTDFIFILEEDDEDVS